MPNATFSTEVEKYDLKTCPGAYVGLRRMSYGAWLKRQELALQMKFAGTGKNEMAGEIGMANRKVTELEFRECVVDHNLEDESGNKLDFSQGATFDKLDPRIGNEVGDYISKLHEWESDLPSS